MKSQPSISLNILAAGLVLAATCAMAQGPLEPLDPPNPTMFSLEEIFLRANDAAAMADTAAAQAAEAEPRTPVSSAPVTLSEPGSYYLTTSLTGTVRVAAHNVTLDLMGFAIISGSGNAIVQSGVRTNLVVRNGVVSAPDQNGIDFSTSTTGANGLIENLRVSDCDFHGIAVGGGFRVRNCQIRGAGLAGVIVYGDSDVRDCTLTGNGTGLQLNGTGAHVAGNIVKGNTDNYNLAAGNQLNLLLCEAPETLDWPCTATFGGTLTCSSTNGIVVNAENVTIDMAGHALVGPGTNGICGILAVSTSGNLTVLNGKLTNWRHQSWGWGINAADGRARVHGIQAIGNRCGIDVGVYSIVADCIAYDNIRDGIRASISTIRNCTAAENGGHGIVASISAIHNCAAYLNGENGITTGSASTIRGCTTYSNTGYGISAGDHSLVAQNVCANNTAGNLTGVIGTVTVDNVAP